MIQGIVHQDPCVRVRCFLKLSCTAITAVGPGNHQRRPEAIEFHDGRVGMKPERKARGLNLGCCKAVRVRQAACGLQVCLKLRRHCLRALHA